MVVAAADPRVRARDDCMPPLLLPEHAMTASSAPGGGATCIPLIAAAAVVPSKAAAAACCASKAASDSAAISSSDRMPADVIVIMMHDLRRREVVEANMIINAQTGHWGQRRGSGNTLRTCVCDLRGRVGDGGRELGAVARVAGHQVRLQQAGRQAGRGEQNRIDGGKR